MKREFRVGKKKIVDQGRGQNQAASFSHGKKISLLWNVKPMGKKDLKKNRADAGKGKSPTKDFTKECDCFHLAKRGPQKKTIMSVGNLYL